MRHVLILLVVALGGGLIWYALEAGSDPLEQEAAIAPGPQAAHEARKEPVREETLQLVAPRSAGTADSNLTASEEPDATPRGRSTLEGTLTNRFGGPVAKERVFLLAGTQTHPPAGSNLADYVTATTSQKGKFSLSLPGEGPWRLAVGPPGQPRMPPSEARTLSATTHAQVVVPGATALRVTFDALPAGDDPLVLEFLTLVEPGVGAGDRGRPADGRGNRRGSRREGAPRPAGRRGGRANRGGGAQGAQPEPGAGGGGRRRGGSDTRDARAPLAGAGEVWASVAQDTERPSAQERPRAGAGLRRSNGQGVRRGQEKDPAAAGEQVPPVEEVQPLGPPAEVWRTRRRHRITDAERTAGVVELGALPAGPVARLTLVIGERRLEGAARFTLRADVVTEVRLFPIDPGADSLGYVAQARPLPAGEAPPGVLWRD